MTILSVLQQAAPFIGLDVPSTVFGETDTELVELSDVANEMAQRIAFEGHDWTKLKTLATLTGDGSATAFSLPSDYKRMIKKAQLWLSTTPFSPAWHVTDTDEWLGMDVQSFTGVAYRWTIIGTQLLIKPAIPDTTTAKFYYLTDAIVDPVSGSNQSTFTLDTDTFLLDERLLRLGVIWQWKAYKGRPYAEDMQTFEDAKAILSGNDRGSTILRMGNGRGLSAETYAFPGILGP